MPLPPVPTFLDHPTSGMAARIAATDWSATPLGPIDGWPVALKATVANMLACPQPMFLAWGPQLLSFYNDAYEPILGYRAGFALGMPFQQLWASIWDEIAPLVDAALAGERAMVRDMLLDISRSGQPEESYWTFSYSGAHDDDGRIAGMLCVTNETTGRVLAERERDASDDRLQLVLSAGNSIGTWDWDVPNDLVRADARFARLYGVDPALAARGAPMADFLAGIHPDDVARVSALVDQAVAGCRHFTADYRLVQADGRVRWVTAQGTCIGDAEGRCIRLPGVSFDVTERVLSAERLRETENRASMDAERVRLALEAGAIVGTWFWDLATDRVTVDEASAAAFDFDLAKDGPALSPAVIADAIHPDDIASLRATMAEVIAKGGAYAHQHRIRARDGRYRWVEGNGRVDLAADGSAASFRGVLVDVDNRRTLERERDVALADLRLLTEQLEQRIADRTDELMRAEEALRQAQKMEAVGQLTGGLAHDFNNLLTGISGALELIEVRRTQGRIGDIERYVAAAQSATRRAAALTHRLLAFSRRQTLAPRATDIDALIAGMAELIERTVGPAIAITTTPAEQPPVVLVDGPQLENALLNLCINARDAMPDGGRISISASHVRLDGERARAKELEPGDYIALEVTDTGTGMPEDVMDKVFDPFFTTKPLGQGTGLGLSMIYGFAKQSGGQVRIRSTIGRGTTVCIYLPHHAGDADVDPVSVDAGDLATGSGETVLVVDDEPSVRLLLRDVLVDLGYAVLEADDAAGALRLLRGGTAIDLMVTDVGLPGGMNGRQLADAARQLRAGMRVIFVTGYAEAMVLDGGQLEPGMEVLTKPFSLDTLATRVRAAIAGQPG